MAIEKFAWSKEGSARFNDAKRQLAPDVGNGVKRRKGPTVKSLKQAIAEREKKARQWKQRFPTSFYVRWIQREIDELKAQLAELEEARQCQ